MYILCNTITKRFLKSITGPQRTQRLCVNYRFFPLVSKKRTLIAVHKKRPLYHCGSIIHRVTYFTAHRVYGFSWALLRSVSTRKTWERLTKLCFSSWWTASPLTCRLVTLQCVCSLFFTLICISYVQYIMSKFFSCKTVEIVSHRSGNSISPFYGVSFRKIWSLEMNLSSLIPGTNPHGNNCIRLAFGLFFMHKFGFWNMGLGLCFVLLFQWLSWILRTYSRMHGLTYRCKPTDVNIYIIFPPF